MKINTNFVILAVTIVLVLFLTLGFGCVKVSPYYKDNLFPRYFNYEGFAPLSPAEFASTGPAPTSGLGVAGNAAAKSAVKVEGFEGLHSAPFSDDKLIDSFSQVSGNVTCTPSPYSNSLGYLCLDEKQKQLLNTRGGNSTGKDSEIGN
jgi:hypothetical protein